MGMRILICTDEREKIYIYLLILEREHTREIKTELTNIIAVVTQKHQSRCLIQF
jgi:hypothetical protein